MNNSFRKISSRYVPICLFLFISFFASSFNVYAQEGGRVEGRVLSGKGSVIENVNIAIEGNLKGTSSDEDGAFTFSDIPAGSYTISASSVGYATSYRQINVKPGEVTKVVFTLYETTAQLSEITVKGEALKEKNRTATVNTVSLENIKSLNITKPERIIEQVPGVDLGAYGQGGVADVFSIRGFGGGGHEGEAGVQIDGISLNEAEGHSDGYADLNVLIPINLSEVNVYKGPSSVLFGRFAEGGTLAFETRKGGKYQDFRLSGGSYETFDAQVALGQPFTIGGKKLRSNLAFQLNKTNGYRSNSDYLKGNINGRLSYDITNNTDIALTLKGHSSRWDAPGFVQSDQFHDKRKRKRQAENAENDGGNKDFASERIDVNHTFSENLRLLIFGYSVQQDFTRFAKFGYEPGRQQERFNTRNVYAAGGSLNGRGSVGTIGIDWVAGVEYYDEKTDRKRWDTDERVRQEQTEKRTFTIESVSAYAEGEFNFSRYFRPSIGLRYDTFYGTFKMRDPGVQAENKELHNLWNISPKLGARSTLFDGFDVRINISNGFSLPNSTSKYDPDLNVDPVQIWQYEAGFSYAHKDWFSVDAAGFILNTSQEIIESPPGSGELINAGKTQRRGIELEAKANPLARLNISGSFTYITSEILDNPDEDMVGNELDGIPSTIGNISADYVLKSGLGARLSLRDVGSYATGADNTNYYSGYTLVNGMLYYDFRKWSSHNGRIFLEVNNIFNEYYAESVFDIFGPTEGQSYAPAPLRNFMVGISYNL